MQAQPPFLPYPTVLAANAAGAVSTWPSPAVVPQTPGVTNGLVSAAGWLQYAPPYSMDLVPGAGATLAPGSVNNWMGWPPNQGQGQQFAPHATYPTMPRPFGEDSRLVAPGGAVAPRGDYAGTITDPVTGQRYAAFTKAMPDPIIPAGGDMAPPCTTGQGADRILEALNGNSALPVRPCRREMTRDWSEALAGSSVPAPLLEQQVLAAQGAQAARDTFFVRKDTPAGYNDTHWDGHIGNTYVLRVLQDTQTVKEYDGGGTSRLPFRAIPDFSLAAPMYHDGTQLGGPMAPVVTILSEEKPAPPGRPMPDALEDLRGMVRMDAVSDSLHGAHMETIARPSNQLVQVPWATAPPPSTSDGPARPEGLGVLPALVALDPRWASASPSMPAANDNGGRRDAFHDATRPFAGPQTTAASVSSLPSVGPQTVPVRLEGDAPMQVRVGAHVMPSTTGGAAPHLSGDGRPRLDAPSVRASIQGQVPMGSSLPMALDPSRAGTMGAEPSFRGQLQATLPVSGPLPVAVDSSRTTPDAMGATLQAQFQPSTSGPAPAPAPSFATVSRRLVHDDPGALALVRADWTNWEGLVQAPMPHSTHPGKWESPPLVRQTGDGTSMQFSSSQPLPALDGVARAEHNPVRVDMTPYHQPHGGRMEDPALPGQRGLRMQDAVRVTAGMVVDPASIAAASAPAFAGDGSAHAYHDALRASTTAQAQGGTQSTPAFQGVGRGLGDGTGLQRVHAMVHQGPATTLAPPPAMAGGPGRWDGGTGALQVNVSVDAQGQQGHMVLPGPGQWDGALGAQRPVANGHPQGKQDTPYTDSGRAAVKFMGAGVVAHVPRSKSLFWTEGVGAYATMPTVENKPTPDRTDTSTDQHVRHLSLLRDMMLAAHPPTGPDTRAKPQPGALRVGAETAAAADCLIAARQHTQSALLNSVLQESHHAIRSSMPLYDVGYESDA